MFVFPNIFFEDPSDKLYLMLNYAREAKLLFVHELLKRDCSPTLNCHRIRREICWYTELEIWTRCP